MWLQWNEFKNIIKSRQVIFWGRGEWVEKTLPYASINAVFIVDRNKNEQGTVEHGLQVYSQERLKSLVDEKDKYYVVITTTDFYNVSDELNSYGFIAGKDYCVTPALINNRILSDIRSYSSQIVLSSSDPYMDSPEKGGGIYIYDTKSNTYEKKISGVTQGFGFLDGKYYIVDDNKGMRIYNQTFTEELGLIDIPKKSRPHGMNIDIKKGLIYVAFSAMDAVGVYDAKNKKLIKQIQISDKFEQKGKAVHHINDLCVHEDSLFISMFSKSGHWKKGVFDGAIMEYDLISNKMLGPVVTGLWMPHNVKVIDGRLCYLDSMRGNFHKTTHKIASTFNGFIRGLDYDGEFYLIGQSVHRYFDRMRGFSNNIALDCGFHIFDDNSKGCKFYALPELLDVHTLEVYAPA